MGSVAISIQLCVWEMLVKQDRVRLGCHSWPLWEELVPSEPANERPVTNHNHDRHMMNIQSMMANIKNGHRSTAPSLYQTLIPFTKYFNILNYIPVNQSSSKFVNRKWNCVKWSQLFKHWSLTGGISK